MPIIPNRSRLRTKLAATGLTAGVLAGSVWAVTAIDGTASASASAKHAGHHGHSAKKGRVLARADHATFEVRRAHQWVTITLDRGQVTSVDASSVTLARPDGRSVTVPLQPSTKYGGAATSAATVQKGRRATVISEQGKAVRVAEAPPRAHAKRAAGGAARSTTPA